MPSPFLPSFPISLLASLSPFLLPLSFLLPPRLPSSLLTRFSSPPFLSPSSFLLSSLPLSYPFLLASLSPSPPVQGCLLPRAVGADKHRREGAGRGYQGRGVSGWRGVRVEVFLASLLPSPLPSPLTPPCSLSSVTPFPGLNRAGMGRPGSRKGNH